MLESSFETIRPVTPRQQKAAALLMEEMGWTRMALDRREETPVPVRLYLELHDGNRVIDTMIVRHSETLLILIGEKGHTGLSMGDYLFIRLNGIRYSASVREIRSAMRPDDDPCNEVLFLDVLA